MNPHTSFSSSGDLTTVGLLESYWRVHWSGFSPAHRAKVRGRLIIMAASLIEPSHSAQLVLNGLDRSKQGGTVTSTAGRSSEAQAARYLKDHFLPRLKGSSEQDPPVLRPETIRAAQWIAAHSKLASAIIDEDLMRLRLALGGNTYQTRRTYAAVIEAVLHWGVATGRLERDPSIGLPKIRRLVDVERVKPDRVPDEPEIWELATLGRSLLGDWFAVAVLLGSYGALRAGELVALRPQNLEFTESGGLWLTVSSQHRRFAMRHSDDGASTSDIAPPKGRIAGPAASRRCYIPSRVAVEIAQYVNQRVSDELLFVSPRGKPYSATTFRGSWDRVVATLPARHRLEGVTPHAMRHAGATLWLKKSIDIKQIQAFGGWSSARLVLDTYAALLPGAEVEAIALLEG